MDIYDVPKIALYRNLQSDTECGNRCFIFPIKILKQ